MCLPKQAEIFWKQERYVLSNFYHLAISVTDTELNKSQS